jgi:hypothetical protein
LEDLRRLPTAVATLIESSPEYFARYRDRPLREQVREASRLSTHLLMLAGGAVSSPWGSFLIMREIIEVRLFADEARRFLAPDVGRERGLSRRVLLELDDPLVEQIREHEQEKRRQDSIAVTFWEVHRKYTQRELKEVLPRTLVDEDLDRLVDGHQRG